MSGETEAEPSGWTPDLLKIYVDARRNDMKELLDERYRSQLREINSALQAINERLAILNELRSNVATEASVEAIEKVVGIVSARLDRIEGKSAGLGSAGNIVVAIVVAAAAVVGIIVSTRS